MQTTEWSSLEQEVNSRHFFNLHASSILFSCLGVGKTSIISRFMTGTFQDLYTATTEDTYRFVVLPILIIIWDQPFVSPKRRNEDFFRLFTASVRSRLPGPPAVPGVLLTVFGPSKILWDRSKKKSILILNKPECFSEKLGL